MSISSTFYGRIFVQKFVQSQTLSREKLLKRLSNEKCECKMFMKLTLTLLQKKVMKHCNVYLLLIFNTFHVRIISYFVIVNFKSRGFGYSSNTSLPLSTNSLKCFCVENDFVLKAWLKKRVAATRGWFQQHLINNFCGENFIRVLFLAQIHQSPTITQ